MELNQVRYFVALARALNFTRAARDCDVTQPALTKGIRKLERELGGPLVLRERQLTQLTDLGKEVLPLLERMLGSEQAVKARVDELSRNEVACLKIGLASGISVSLVLDSLHNIRASIPNLRVELTEARGDALVEMLLSGEINAAVLGQLDEKPSRIDEWPLFEERFLVAVGVEHSLASSLALTVEDLKTSDLLTCPDSQLRDTVLRLVGSESGAHSGHSSRQQSHLQKMAAAGFGVILVPEHMPLSDALVTIPLEGSPVSWVVSLMVVQGRRYSPALDAFVRSMRQRKWHRQ